MKRSNLFQAIVADVETNRHKRNPFDEKYLTLCSTSIENDDESAATNIHVRVELLRSMGQHLQKQLGSALRHYETKSVPNRTRNCKKADDNALRKEIEKLIRHSTYKKLFSDDFQFLNSLEFEVGRSRHLANIHEIHLDPVKECPPLTLQEFFISKFNTSSPGKVTAVELLTNPYFNQTESGFRNDLNTLPPGHWNDTENDFSFSLGSAQFTGELPSFDSLFDTNHSIQHNKSLMETKFIEDSAAVLDCVLSEEDEVEEDVCESIKTTDPSPYEMQISDASDMEILPKRKRKQREIHRSPSPGLDLLKSLNQTLKQKKKTKTRKLNKLETERSSDAIQGQRTNQQTPVFAQDSIKPTPVDPFAFNEACSLDSAKQNPPKLPPNSTMDLAPVKQLESRLDYTRSRSYGLNVPVINSNFTEVKTAKQLQQETYESPTPRAHSESLHLEISSASEFGDSISDNSVTFQCQNSIHVQKRSTDKSVEDVTLNRINTLQEKSSLSINLEIESCTSEELSIEILQSSPRRNSPPVLTAQQDDEFSISEASSLRADHPGPSLPPVPSNELQGLLLQMRTLLRSHFQSTGDALSLQELHQLVNGVSGSNTVSIKRLFFAVLHLARTPDVQVTFHGTSNQRHLSLSLYDTNDEPNFEFNEFIFEETDNRTC